MGVNKELMEYGILYGKPNFPSDHKLRWMNYAIGQMPKDLSDKVKELSESVNSKYSDKIIIPLDNKIYPGIVCEPDAIEEIANFVFNEFNLIFKELTGDEGVYKIVWSIGKMDEVEEIIKQSTRVSKTPTLHHLNPYPVIVKVGRFIDKAESGIFKV
jgi:hypothetical protein